MRQLPNPDETIIDDDSILGVSEDITELQNDIDAQLDKMFMEIGSAPNDQDFKINVYRILPGKGEKEYCFSCVPSELPIMDRLRDEWGGGMFMLWIYRNGKIYKRPTVNVGRPLAKPSSAPSADSQNLLNGLIQMQREQFQQMQQILQRQAAPASSAVDPMQMMGSMMAVMLQMKNFMAPPSQENDFEKFARMLEITKDLVSDAGGEKSVPDMILGLAKEFGPPLMQMTSKLAEQQANMPTMPHAGPVPNPQPRMIPSQQNPEHPDMSLALKMQLKMLVNRAHANSDPALYADMILDNLPPHVVSDFVQRPDALDYLASIEPGVRTAAPWFAALRDELISALAPDPDEGETGLDNGPGVSTESGEISPTAAPENPTDEAG